jgi:hypothetical protein
MWTRENIDLASPQWLAGASDYHVDGTGKVVKHVINPKTE